MYWKWMAINLGHEVLPNWSAPLVFYLVFELTTALIDLHDTSIGNPNDKFIVFKHDTILEISFSELSLRLNFKVVTQIHTQFFWDAVAYACLFDPHSVRNEVYRVRFMIMKKLFQTTQPTMWPKDRMIEWIFECSDNLLRYALKIVIDVPAPVEKFECGFRFSLHDDYYFQPQQNSL